MYYPVIDKVIVELGPLSIRWYGLMYVLGVAVFYLLGKRRIRRGLATWRVQDLADLVFYGVVGVIVGGRLGFVLFYGIDTFLRDPLMPLRIWEGGMSFHGGLLGVIAACWVFAKRSQRSFLAIADFAAPLAPLGLGLGRLGNFINAELPGRVTELPIGVYFPCDSVRELTMRCFGEYEAVTRHVSSLYQAASDGVVLFLVVWLFAAKPRAAGQVSAVFLLVYGCLRFLTEFVREPDPGRGFVALDWMTTGQLLSVPMVALGVVLMLRRRPANQTPA
ncbi:MAG: prolipoprotein diacylglyceryl transferase [Gammaproteobacteria bacterium]|nr:prolipoprotein diacylglyceryl transferase [Gammaproteobacteria bacterium]MXY58099.1 prolipoprotein diacylglyceryl transferase [Gammaproteobacteria bacterium]MYF30575.1 prolipoprotein diacylglyceryl transferase [Gammaproteobacteria bacterium]MYK48469.1 prolipoprotein diacylglyceryl transferase [Gammaproteobacteria bacterium]